MTARLFALYLRSRRAGWALCTITACILASAAGLHEVIQAERELGLALLLLPLLPAAVIGGSIWSPFGEPEAVAGGHLPRLRLVHVCGLLLFTALVLAPVTASVFDADTSLAVTRNLAGYAGMALIGARLFGAGPGWSLVIIYASALTVIDARSRLGWPLRHDLDASSLGVAAALLLAGLWLVARRGAVMRDA